MGQRMGARDGYSRPGSHGFDGGNDPVERTLGRQGVLAGCLGGVPFYVRTDAVRATATLNFSQPHADSVPLCLVILGLMWILPEIA
jgi:hypothetical protein